MRPQETSTNYSDRVAAGLTKLAELKIPSHTSFLYNEREGVKKFWRRTSINLGEVKTTTSKIQVKRRTFSQIRYSAKNVAPSSSSFHDARLPCPQKRVEMPPHSTLPSQMIEGGPRLPRKKKDSTVESFLLFLRQRWEKKSLTVRMQ